jgi:hypothetical protein
VNYLGWLLLIVVLGLITYPIVLLVPSKQQKQLMTLRQAAIGRGLRIQIRPPKLPDALQSQYPDLPRTAAYLLPEPHSRLTTRYLAVRSNQPDEWFWLDKNRPPAALMQAMLDLYKTLPDYCLAVEQGNQGSALFVRERFGEQELDKLCQLLTKLNQMLVK